jgi:hypothetical protein
MFDLAQLIRRPVDTGVITGTCVVASAGGVATVDVGTAQLVVNVARGLTVALGDVVLVAKQGSSRFVTSILYSAPPAAVSPDVPPPPAPSTVTGTTTVRAVSTGSYRAGKWRTDTDDLVQGVTPGQGNSIGCAFYGRAPKALAGATVLAARLTVRRIRGGSFAAQAPTLRLVTQTTRPAGAPSLTSSTVGPSLKVGATTSTFVVPASWGQQMVDGTAGGLAVYDSAGDPYVRLAGRSAFGPAFALKISWKRSS